MTRASLRRWRRVGSVGIVGVVAVLARGVDPFALVLLSVAMGVFYGVAILVGALRARRHRRAGSE